MISFYLVMFLLPVLIIIGAIILANHKSKRSG